MHDGRVCKCITRAVFLACMAFFAACAGSQATAPSTNAPAQESTVSRGVSTRPTSAITAHTQKANRSDGERICGEYDSEEAAANQVLSLCGSGLAWLVLPTAATEGQGPALDAKDLQQAQKRSADDIAAARTLAECLMRRVNAGFDQTHEQGFDALESWVDAHLASKHPHVLLAAGASYFASLLTADSLMDAVLDIPAARLFLERSIDIDASLYDGLAPMLVGAYECFMPQPIGGKPKQGLARLEQAAAQPGRFRLAMKVAAAELCAYSLQDRALFDRLIHEVLSGPRGTDAVIDMLAQAHARDLTTEADELFALGEGE